MGLFSKIFKGIKKIVKGVVKGVKNVVKGVAKVVKKVAKSKVFKAILMAAAIYVTGGAAAGAFGASGSGFFGTWAATAGNVVAGTSALGTAGTLLTPFAKLGTALGTGARGISDLAGWTTKGAELGASGITGVESATAERGVATAERATAILQQAGPNATAAEVATAAREIDFKAGLQEFDLSTLPQKRATTKTTSKFVQGLGSWASNVTGSVASGYILSELQGEDPAGAMFAGDIEGKRYFDPLEIYGMDGRPLDINSVYENLLYGNIDPFAAKDPLYTQATIPAV